MPALLNALKLNSKPDALKATSPKVATATSAVPPRRPSAGTTQWVEDAMLASQEMSTDEVARQQAAAKLA